MSTISAYTGDGSTTQFDITFTYRDASTVKASVDGVETSAFTFVNPSRIQFTTAPANGAEIKVFRRTSLSPAAVAFEDGAIIRGDDLNDAIAQPRDRAEELDSSVSDLDGRTMKAPLGETLTSLPAADDRAGKFAVYDEDGNPAVADGALAVAALASNITDTAGRTVQNTIDEQPYSVLAAIPSNLHAAIAARTITADLAAYFNTAAIAANLLGRPLYVPKGTYTMKTWSPPTGLTVITDGYETEFKQLDTAVAGVSVPQRFIVVSVDNVKLWPGGSATVNGGMTAVPTYGLPGVNATSFNSGIQVYAGNGVTINRFEVGDILGLNIGGDVIETGAVGTGVLGHVSIGTVYADNVYRNGVSITAGLFGHIEAVLQQSGGVGYLTLDFEPDAGSSSTPLAWTVGQVRGHRIAVSANSAAPAGRLKIAQLHQDYTAYGSSTPAFNYGGVSAGTQPVSFGTAMQYRNWDAIDIDQAYIANFPQTGITDASSGGDTYTRLVRFGRLKMVNCDAGTGRSMQIQKTYHFLVEHLSITKSNSAFSVIDGATASDSLVDIRAGQVTGRITNGLTGALNVGPIQLAGAFDNIFRNVVGQIIVDGLFMTQAANIVFDTCTKAPIVRGATLSSTGAISSGGAANAFYTNCVVNGTSYIDRLHTPGQTAVGDATNAAAAPTQAEFNAFVAKFNLLLDKLGTSGAGVTQDA